MTRIKLGIDEVVLFLWGKGGVARGTPLAAFQKSMSQTKTYFRTIKNLCFPFIDFIEVPILESTS